MVDKQVVAKDSGCLNPSERASASQRSVPAVDIYETDQELVLLADLPGVEQQDLQIEVSGGVLTIEAARSVEGAAPGSYYRQFKISEQIDTDAGEAALDAGVLTLRLPKSAAAKAKKIPVKTLH